MCEKAKESERVEGESKGTRGGGRDKSERGLGEISSPADERE